MRGRERKQFPFFRVILLHDFNHLHQHACKLGWKAAVGCCFVGRIPASNSSVANKVLWLVKRCHMTWNIQSEIFISALPHTALKCVYDIASRLIRCPIFWKRKSRLLYWRSHFLMKFPLISEQSVFSKNQPKTFKYFSITKWAFLGLFGSPSTPTFRVRIQKNFAVNFFFKTA